MSSLTVYTKAAPVAWAVLAAATYLSGPGSDFALDVDSSDAPGSSVVFQSQGQSHQDPASVLKLLAAAYPGLAGVSSLETTKVEELLSLVQSKVIGVADFAALSAVANQLDDFLTLRSYAVGYALSVADFALWGALKGNVTLLGILKRNLHPHLARFYAFIDSLPSTKAAVAAFQAAQKQKVKSRTTNAAFELGLPNAVHGQVCTRLPPEPSGYLHIGHAKAAILNQYFARHYEGTFLVRFDDTNPSKEKAEFQDSILEDLQLLGIQPDSISYTSDYFDKLFQYAIQMIKDGKAYTDDTPQLQMRQERMDGIASAHRDDPVDLNLEHFSLMQSGSEAGLKWCLRAKISFDNPNKALRDPVIYRCNLEPHHRTGTTWKIYPGYDFACPIVDSMEGVTHALRTNEYRDRNPQYWWMLKALGLRKVDVWDFGRVSFVYTLLSKRKLKDMIEEKHLVTGWDDPRFPTVRGMRRRGLTIEALTQYMLAQGPSQAVTSLEWDAIWTINKKVIDPIAPRHAAVAKKNLVKVTISGSKSEPYQQAVPKHKKNLDIGNKSTTYGPVIYVEQEDALSFGDNEEITLMDWGNAIVRKKHVNSANVVESIEAHLHLEGDFKKTSKKVHWLAPADSAPLIDVTLVDFDYLITKKKIEEGDDWTDFINPTTEFRTPALADNNVRELQKGDIIQFERKGFYIVDRAYDDATKDVELIFIPDGKASSVVLKCPVDAQSRPKTVNTKTINMYAVDNITGELPPADLSKVNMYKVPSIYA